MRRPSQNGSFPSRCHSGAVIVRLLAAIAVMAAAAYGGLTWWRLEPQSSLLDKAILHEVERSDFLLAITERGEVESADDIEVRSQVQTKNQPGLAILRIVPEGTLVAEGDFLVELDSSALREERTLQQITCNTVQALVVEAKNVYETAVIAEREYIEGTFVQEKETLESELFVAEETLSRAEEYLKYSEKLAAKGYVNDLQLQADKFAVDKARKEADAARTKLRVLERFTRAKMLKDLKSQILIAKAKWEAEQNSLKLELGKLEELDKQIALCTIRSPNAGVVKYAHVRDRRGQEDFLVEEGALIRERQVVILLPDSNRMRVVMEINESLVQFVRPNMPAEIKPIGLSGPPLKGKVERVNAYAEPSGWRKANVKEYKAYVLVENPSTELRSGMTASVTIRSLFEPDVIQAPVQAVYAHGDQRFCFAKRGDSLVALPVECGATNDNFYIVTSGLDVSDRVALNPRALVDLVSLPELPPVDAQEQSETPVASESEEQPTVAARPVSGAKAAGG